MEKTKKFRITKYGGKFAVHEFEFGHWTFVECGTKKDCEIYVAKRQNTPVQPTLF